MLTLTHDEIFQEFDFVQNFEQFKEKRDKHQSNHLF